MPCYTDPHQGCAHDNNEIQNSICIIRGIMESSIEYYKSKSDEATSLLCYVLNNLEQINFSLNGFDEKIRNWWEAHKKFDAERNNK